MARTNKILGFTQIFVALGAIPAGLSLLFDPDGSGLGLPIELLKKSPFQDFLVPGIFLFTVNGLCNVLGAWAVFTKKWYAGGMGIALGVFLVAWIGIQAYFIGFDHFLQALYLGIGVFEIILACYLTRKQGGEIV